ncbi:putative acetamidase regulatory protein [Xylogone sp. PMI_703]|nr:putative acetamidase regulatory protein [Xylogone sp. PMI_703]
MDRSSPKRQQMKSCDTCRKRKVRCDSVRRSICTNCRRADINCSFTTTWKRPMRSKQINKEDAAAQSSSGRVEHAFAAPSIVDEPQERYDVATTPEEDSGILDSVTISEDLARNSLPEFYRRGIGASTWSVFQRADLMRIAYIGTEISNLSHLITLQAQAHGNADGVWGPPLHLPHPAIRPTRPWKPEADHNTHIPLSREYLHDLSSFPEKEVRDSLVESYFKKINPYFPVIDESQFRRQYANPASPPPLLLFQSVLLAGAHVSDHPKVIQARPMVRNALFRRAKALFEMRHENDRLHLVQSALLFTWHLENADTASSNSYYWVGVACRIAFGIGMHRDLTDHGVHVVLMPLNDRRIYRRVWWTLFQVEIFTALEHGRPSMIDLDEIDQPPLDIDDYTEENGLVNDSLHLDYCQRNIDLCYIILQVLKINSPGIRRKLATVQSIMKSLDSSLASWILMTPAASDFASLQLHLHYYSVLLHLHRNNRRDSPLIPWQAMHASTEICTQSVNAIITIFETILSSSMLSQCYFTCVTAATAAAIHISQAIGNALDQSSTLLAITGLGQLERLLMPTKELGKFWAHGEAVYNLFQSLSQRFRARISELMDKPTEVQANIIIQSDTQAIGSQHENGSAQDQQWNITNSEQANQSIHDIDLQDLLLYPVIPQQSIQGNEDWMNVSPEQGLGIR